MIKRIYRLSLYAIAAIMAFACTDPVEEPTKNKLSVTPDGTLEFMASANDNVVLAVETDAKSWDFEVSEDWIVAEKAEKTLKINVKDNTSSARAGRITVTAGNAAAVKITVTQAKAEEVKPFLKVTPSEPINFLSTGNEPIELTVETNVSSWDYSITGDWIGAVKGENTLTLTAQDNTNTNKRAGRITISAEGTEAVKINATQDAFNPQAGKVSLSDANGGNTGSMEIANLNMIDFPLTVKLDKALNTDAQVNLVYDAAHVAAYNVINGTSYQAFPEHLVTIPNDGEVTIPSGNNSVSVTLKINPDNINDLRNNVDYLIPIIVKPATGSGLTAPSATSRVNYTIARKCKKEVKNVVYIDTKDTNPLNFLELRLEDGSMMVDAVVLFAANINWDGKNQEVILNNNGCTQGLLDQTETYLQPLRKAGIKVLLGLLGNHDGAGIANLSEYGAQEYSKTLANAVKKYKLDGISFDDEYSDYGTLSGEWFDGQSAACASRLLYFTKKSMQEIVPWDTYTMVYYYGNISAALPSYNGVQPGKYVDIAVADYPVGGAATMLGMDKKQCSGGSIEMNEGRGTNPDQAATIKSRGYGWMMWFSYNPVRKPDNVRALQTAAKGLYDNMKLMDPQYVYKKATMGTHNNDFDPNPYPFSW